MSVYELFALADRRGGPRAHPLDSAKLDAAMMAVELVELRINVLGLA
jgi:hypothetical protein